MKLQHKSGAVIEDARIEERGDFFYTVCGATRGCIYSKADWRRVPEERWERVDVFIAQRDHILVICTTKHSVALPDGYRWNLIDGNLCVERRVEGA